MRRTILWHAVTGLVLSGLVTLSSGCRKELCYNHDEHAYSVKVDVTATWEREWERDHGRGWKNTWEGRGWNSWMTYDDLRPEVPGGIRAVVYDPDGNRHDERNLAAEGGRAAGQPRCSSMPPSATGARGRRYVRSASPTGRATDIPGLLTATTPCSSKCA